jgi:two-component system chemotaxis response regulator CheY
MSKMNILVVDDTSMMRAMHHKHLIAMGILEKNIRQAENGELAIAVIKELISEKRKIDLIICDWDMPVLTGIDFLKKIKAVSSLKDVKFLMVTARGEKKDLLRAIQSGVSGYIIKPFKVDAYVERVMSLLAQGFIDK